MSVLLKRKSDGTVEGEANEGCRSPDGFEGTARPAARQSARQGSEWPGAELNRRHADFQSAALPTELPGRAMQQKNLAGYMIGWEWRRAMAWASFSRKEDHDP